MVRGVGYARAVSNHGRESVPCGHAFERMEQAHIAALVLDDDAVFTSNARVIAAPAAKRRMASIGNGESARAGALMGYGTTTLANFHRAAAIVDRILKGAKPGDIPIEQPTKFEFVMNLKTANAFGLDVPPILLVRADEVIER
jgi:putative ABC transport system substrate-binding protein